MRYVVISLIVMALWAPAIAQPVSPRLDSMRVTLFGMLNMAETGDRNTSVADANRAINIGLAETCENFPVIEAYDTLYFSNDSNGVALPHNCVRVYDAYQLKGDSIRIPMTLVKGSGRLDSLLPAEGDNVFIPNAKPMTLPGRLIVYGKRAREHPKMFGVADSTLVVEILYYAQADRLSSDSDTTVASSKYVMRTIYYAASLLSVDREDYDGAKYYYDRWADGATPPITREQEGK